jgi:hypothetical protein
MPRTPAKFTQTQIERVLKAAIRGGFNPSRFEVEGGKIIVYAVGSESNDNASPLDQWRRKNGEG